LLHQRLQLVELGIAGCKVQEETRLASKAGLDQGLISELYRRWFPAAVCAGPPTPTRLCPPFWRHPPARAGPSPVLP
jgi:hypothetical protein